MHPPAVRSLCRSSVKDLISPAKEHLIRKSLLAIAPRALRAACGPTLLEIAKVPPVSNHTERFGSPVFPIQKGCKAFCHHFCIKNRYWWAPKLNSQSISLSFLLRKISNRNLILRRSIQATEFGSGFLPQILPWRIWNRSPMLFSINIRCSWIFTPLIARPITSLSKGPGKSRIQKWVKLQLIQTFGWEEWILNSLRRKASTKIKLLHFFFFQKFNHSWLKIVLTLKARFSQMFWSSVIGEKVFFP